MLVGCGPVAVSTTQHHLFDREAKLGSQPEYRIGVGDELEIKFLHNPEMNERVPVRPDGRISMPLAKQVVAAGLTPGELENLLYQRYAPELKKPDVTVMVRGFYAQKIWVDGEVSRPGLVPMMGSMSVLQAIANAGGFRETARLSEVLVIRRTQEKPLVTILDLEAARNNTDMSQDIYLMPSDIVFVPRSKIANLNLWVDQYIRRLIPFSLPQVIPTPSYIFQSGSAPVY
jgi:protein involved in polysaccharide export with SLBB domain